MAGKSGFDHKFSFILPKTKLRSQAILHGINALTRELATSVAFAVNDVRGQRDNDDIKAYSIINDKDTRPPEDYIDALKAYNITPYRWSEREGLVSEFSNN
jgi:hypothetical protein